ncbi:hypothetical protein ACQ4PT_016448 [Festuca glaucescens]
MELVAREASAYARAATPDASAFNVDERLLSKPLLRPTLIGARVRIVRPARARGDRRGTSDPFHSVMLYEVSQTGFKTFLPSGTMDNLKKQGLHEWDKLILSSLQDRIDENTVLSDVVGLVNKVTDMPPSGKAKSHKRQVYTMDGRYRFVVRAVDIDSVDIPSAKFADLYLFGPRGEVVIGKEAWMLVSAVRGQANAVPQDLLVIVGKEFNVVVTPRRESLDSLHSHLQVQIAEPIVRSSGTLQEDIAKETAGQLSKGLANPQAASQTSTPPSYTSTTPQSAPSSASATDELLPESSGRIKRKNDEASKNPKSKKGLHF